MDAGQFDSGDSRASIRNLVAAQEKQSVRVKTSSTPDGKGTSDHKRSQKRPNINVTTNPLDISLIGSQSCNTQGCNGQGAGVTTKSRGRSAGKLISGRAFISHSLFIFSAKVYREHHVPR